MRERGIVDYIIRLTSEKGKECVVPLPKGFGLPSGRRGQGIRPIFHARRWETVILIVKTAIRGRRKTVLIKKRRKA